VLDELIWHAQRINPHGEMNSQKPNPQIEALKPNVASWPGLNGQRPVKCFRCQRLGHKASVWRTILPSDTESTPSKQTSEKAAKVEIVFPQPDYLHKFESDGNKFPITDLKGALTWSVSKQQNDQRIFCTAICSLEDRTIKFETLVDTGATTNVKESNIINMELRHLIPSDSGSQDYCWKCMKSQI
jgi:hypothetical protein